ncbi:MAG: hypothetical protein ACOVP4_00040 [Bacteriovoracaceae bacterium]|jgi:hypothetical protein
MKDYKDLKPLTDKKLRTLRNNLNNRLQAFSNGSAKALPPSHMLHGLEEGHCKELLVRVGQELKTRA